MPKRPGSTDWESLSAAAGEFVRTSKERGVAAALEAVPGSNASGKAATEAMASCLLVGRRVAKAVASGEWAEG